MNYVYPDNNWNLAKFTDLGWSSEALLFTRKRYETWPKNSVMVLDHGHLIASWGDITQKVKVSSIRKSILITLFGILLQEKPFNLDTTLFDLGIDDVPPLTDTEKQATIRMILQSRSGIYHDYIGGSSKLLLDKPERGSQAPGSHWYYNNWDFNCAGAIFEKIFDISIADAFIKYLVEPLDMQDFQHDDFYYFPCNINSKQDSKDIMEQSSVYPTYHFRLTTRDLARFASLLTSGGQWRDNHIIPRNWYQQMTTGISNAYSSLCPVTDSQYGLFFWINSFEGISEPNFSAKGSLGKYIIIFPLIKLAIICQNHTNYPDVIAQNKEKHEDKLPTILDADMIRLITQLLKSKIEINL